jgi:epoxyqueuosine reductase
VAGTISELVEGAGRKVGGIDALRIIPLPDLTSPGEPDGGVPPSTATHPPGSPLDRTLSLMRRGFIPDRYGWTPGKTEKGYRYKSYAGWAKSVIVAAMSYHTDEEYPRDPGYGRIARYTWRNNYGRLVMHLERLAERLQSRLGRGIRRKTLSNYTSIPEKVLGACAGIGEPGSHCVLIRDGMGTRFVLGEIFTDIDIPGEDAPPLHPPDFSYCGACTLCMDRCPTGAIRERGALDINRCIQYLSENLLIVPPAARLKWGNRLYGCSLCTDVCPANGDLQPRAEKHGLGYVGTGMDLIDFLDMGEEEFFLRFRDNQIGIRRFDAVMKNAIIACGSILYEGAADRLRDYLHHPEPILRAHAAWSLGRLGKRSVLEKHRVREKDRLVLWEIGAALGEGGAER